VHSSSVNGHSLDKYPHNLKFLAKFGLAGKLQTSVRLRLYSHIMLFKKQVLPK